jgi:hypothetical protein
MNQKTAGLCVSMLSALQLVALSLSTHAADAPPDIVELAKRNTRSLAYTDTTISGPGADHLLAATADAQFVLFGEDHLDHEIPRFAGALYSTLHDQRGFRHLVVEQDPLAIEDALATERRGDTGKIAAHARAYPTLYEFDTDEDLAVLALAGHLEKGPDAIWGVEQSTGAVRYLEELSKLAPNATVRARVEKMLAEARVADDKPTYHVNWLIAEGTSPALAALRDEFKPRDGSRAHRLLDGLTRSAEVFGYYRRADAGEWVALFNNTVREEVLKSNFIERYRAAAKREALPKALFKFGANHLYHGRNPTNAHPIGNLAHELAIFNGKTAYGLFVLPLGPNYSGYKDLPPWLLPLLPAQEPATPVLIDLVALRPYQKLYRDQVAEADKWQLRDLMNGYQAIVLLPGSRPGERKLGGR